MTSRCQGLFPPRPQAREKVLGTRLVKKQHMYAKRTYLFHCVTFCLPYTSGKLVSRLYADWLTERRKFALSFLLGITRRVPQVNSVLLPDNKHILHRPSLFGQDGWDIGLVLFYACLWASTPSRSRKITLPITSILTSRLVNNPYILLISRYEYTIPDDIFSYQRKDQLFLWL